MYTPARSDLLALAIAVLATTLLLRVMEAASSPALAIIAFVAIPTTPTLAAWISGPWHSMTSRFFYRGLLAVAGMAAAIVAAGATAATESASILLGAIWALPTAALALILLLITDTLVRLRQST
jgi:hypothetical protein